MSELKSVLPLAPPLAEIMPDGLFDALLGTLVEADDAAEGAEANT